MKMSAEEIITEYQKDPSRANMVKIAEANNATLEEIGNYLKDAAAPKKKMGRPKGSKNRKSTRSDKTLKDTSKKTSDKVESLPREMRANKYLIPPLLESIAKEKIDEYRRIAEIHREQAQKLDLEANELQDFLNGGLCDGD